jgi:DNA-binding transcriptional LysR family regulator
MLDWDKLRVFHAVAQAQSLTRAGEVLNLSQSAVSRQVSGLEEQLGTTLFHRHARGLILTEQGEILFRTASEMSQTLRATENALSDSRERPKGPLIVSSPVAIGTMWLTPHLAEFQKLYPDIVVTLNVQDSDVNVAMREADCAIRVYPSDSPDIIQRQITTINNDLYASNDYLRKHGIPRSVEELRNHQLIAYGEHHRPPFSEIDWLLNLDKKKGRLNPDFKVNSLFGMLRAAEQGMGIAGLPDYMTRDARDISPVLPKVKGPAVAAYFVYATELRNSKRIIVFRDFLLRKFASTEF